MKSENAFIAITFSVRIPSATSSPFGAESGVANGKGGMKGWKKQRGGVEQRCQMSIDHQGELHGRMLPQDKVDYGAWRH